MSVVSPDGRRSRKGKVELNIKPPPYKKIPFGCKPIDELFLGGVKVTKPMMIFGRSGIGKTWLCVQLASNFTRIDKTRKVLYINTEADFDDETIPMILGYFKKRWRDMDESRIEFRDIRTLFDLGRFFGMQFEIEIKEKSVTAIVKYPKTSRPVKTSVKDEAWFQASPFYKLMSSGKYGLVIIDSLSAVVKPEIPRGTQYLPARATLQTPLLSTWLTSSLLFYAPVVFTVHGSVNPQGQALDSPFGGEDLKFYIKHILGILPPTKDIVPERYKQLWRRFRRIWRYRYGFLDREMATVVLAKDYGYTDLSYLSGGVA